MKSFIEKISSVITVVGIENVIFIVSAIFVGICTGVSILYSNLCEKEYGIPRIYFMTDLKHKVLEVVLYTILIFALVLCWPLIEGSKASVIVKYCFRFISIVLVLIILYVLISKASVNRMKNDGWNILLIVISAEILAADSVKELIAVLSITIILLLMWILNTIYKSLKNKNSIIESVKPLVLFIVICVLIWAINTQNIQLNLIKMVVVLLYFVLFHLLLILLALDKIDLIKVFKDFKHQGQYETIRIKSKEYIVLSHYNDMIVCVKYEFVKENSQLILHTDSYELINVNAGKVQYKDFSKGLGSKFEVNIIK